MNRYNHEAGFGFSPAAGVNVTNYAQHQHLGNLVHSDMKSQSSNKDYKSGIIRAQSNNLNDEFQ